MEKATGVTPRALQDRKILREDCRGYMAMFYELSPTRTYNEAGQQPLQPSEVSVYLTEYGISGGERRAKFLRMVRNLDTAYMEYQFKKQEQARAETK